MNSDIHWILQETVMHVHRLQIEEHGGLPGVRDFTLLESALARPQNHYAHNQTIRIPEIGAIYAKSISQNHPFNDGNKRTALVTSFLFLEINGFEITATEEEATIMFIGLASNEVKEDELKGWFVEKSKKIQEIIRE